MKRLLFLLAASSVLSCNRSASGGIDQPLLGSWKMVAVENIAAQTVITKEQTDAENYCGSRANCDVVIEFGASASGNTLRGHTITNKFSGTFTPGSDNALQLDFGFITKLGDSEWSEYLISNFTARYNRSVGMLSLYSDDNARRLVFIKN